MAEGFLIGGARQEGGRRSRPRKEKAPAPRIGVRFFVPLLLIGGLFVATGYWTINVVFTARDYEMESARKQELIQKRREEIKLAQAKVSNWRRVETLRHWAKENTDLQEPAPAAIERLKIPAELTQRWSAAAREVAENAPDRKGGSQ